MRRLSVMSDGESTTGPSGFINGLAEIAGKGIGNIPMGIVHGVKDLASRATGHGTQPSEPTFPLSENAKSVGQGISDAIGAAAEPYRVKAAEPFLNDYVAPVLSDVAEIAPAVGAAKGITGAAREFSNRPNPVAEASPPTPSVPLSAEDQSGSRQSMGASQVNPSPFTLTGQETGRGSPWFPQIKLAKNAGDVPANEQSTRAQIVREVLSDADEKDAGIRTGVLTGNEQTLRSEYQAAKNPNQTPANALMADQISAEQRALPKFAQQRIDATGTDRTLTNDYQRGETINNAFYGPEGLKSYLNQQKSKIYQAALEKNGNDRIPIDVTETMFKDPQFAAGAKLMKHEGVVGGAQDLLDLAKNVGFKDPVTGVQYEPGSVAAYHAVTKALNKGWTPENSVTIGKINDAINQDIAKSGGGDLYKLGNAVHQLDKTMLSDSSGISDVFGAVDANGIQTGKDFENIPKTLNNLPTDQWRHIHDTLDTLSRGHLRGAPEGMDPIPQELQQAAARAKAEMHGALAREVYGKGAGNNGGWSAHKANETLNGRVGQKILDAFPSDEIRKFQTLNAAGHIMPGAHAYEGAGAQTARMGREPGFIENYAPKAGIVLGAKTMVPGAALVGEKLGEKISGLTRGRREAKQANQVSQTLRDNLNRAMGGTVLSRATGGRTGPSDDELVRRLMARWHKAKRGADASTKPLLNVPDAAIIHALKVSGAAI
jgi:hypothetical protein